MIEFLLKWSYIVGACSFVVAVVAVVFCLIINTLADLLGCVRPRKLLNLVAGLAVVLFVVTLASVAVLSCAWLIRGVLETVPG